jgi:hypothetical protein
MAVVLVHFVIGEDGTPISLETQAHKILWSGVEGGIQNVRFPRECRGKELDIKYTFRFDLKLDYRDVVVVFEPPGNFIISNGVLPAMPDRQTMSQR